RIFLRKTRRKILCSQGSHFSSKNKEENPLLARLAFFFEKQGGKSSARKARIFLRKTRRIVL
ncbi:MAG: hypothetical protein PHP50_13885, partial [Lachnospiraceae bacterium]|nr:hypothetical protein [Lachnospiraceae bacterium]